MTTERTHLSIGEVLSLLQPEFPDITISKIRFLESQGLLDPERTPSGYRKFHDDDIERLRWILTQQRDHFLPLKVIKDRLASGDLSNGTPEGVLPLAADSADAATDTKPVPAWASTAPEGAAGTVTTAAPASAPRSRGAAPSTPDEPVPADTDPASAATDEAGTDEATGATAPTAPSGNGSEPAAEESPTAETAPDTEAGHDRAEAVGQLVEAPETPAPDPIVEPAAAEEKASSGTGPTTGKKSRRRHPTGHQPGAPTPEPGADVEPEATVVALTLDDLTARSGLTGREVTELERYGLISGETDGQVMTYDEEALVVARLAAGFNRYGIEPRHLRMYKVAAEREAGLFEQLISPLLKQRRPAARQQAVEMLEDLAELADDLRAAMVRTALREYLGGS